MEAIIGLASGCYWGREYHLRQLPGVLTTRVGFAGGHAPDPTYQQVCTKTTGHAETVEVIYDSAKLSTRALLTEFFTLHDFTVDRRENGGQYRSAIFLYSGQPAGLAQEKTALTVLAELRSAGYPPATELRWIDAFYPAASRHQQYCVAHGMQPKKQERADVKKILTLP
ncbi:MAG: peptide-methionine (S)-S-oxide reductase MsrA [Bacteroidota bacterium]